MSSYSAIHQRRPIPTNERLLRLRSFASASGPELFFTEIILLAPKHLGCSLFLCRVLKHQVIQMKRAMHIFKDHKMETIHFGHSSNNSFQTRWRRPETQWFKPPAKPGCRWNPKGLGNTLAGFKMFECFIRKCDFSLAPPARSHSLTRVACTYLDHVESI